MCADRHRNVLLKEHCRTFSRAVSKGHGAKESVGADFSPLPVKTTTICILSEDERAMRLRLLDAALEYTDAHGWTVDALIEGAVAIGLSPQAHGIALRGPVELVEHAVHTMDREFAASAPEKVSEMLSMEEDPTLANALAVAAKLRMQLIVPRLERWPQAMALEQSQKTSRIRRLASPELANLSSTSQRAH